MAEPNIEVIIKELLKLMNVSFDSVERFESPESKHTRFLVKTGEPSLLIGATGEHLGAFNYIVRRIAAKQSNNDSPVKFFVDVNDYHEKTMESVKAKAKIMSERARSFKADIEMEPMTAYERMLIHSFLEGAPDIKTESKGEGAERRVVIKYIERTAD